MHVDGKRSCKGACILIFIATMNIKKHPGYEAGTLKKAAAPVPEHECSLSLSDGEEVFKR